MTALARTPLARIHLADDIPAAVHAYAEAGGLKKYSPTTSTRRVIAALRAIGLERADFQVRNPDGGGNGYKGAVTSFRGGRLVYDVVVANADLLAECGCSVTLVELPSGAIHPIVSCGSKEPGVYRLPRAPAGAREGVSGRGIHTGSAGE